jgi:hypothetical protein
MDEAKALMDKLMGIDRNTKTSLDPSASTTRSCYDPTVCPYYTVWGVDVYELFSNTRSSIGVNNRTVDDSAHEDWLRLSRDEQMYQHCGEVELLVLLTNLVKQCDANINKNNAKLKQEYNAIVSDTNGGVECIDDEKVLVDVAGCVREYNELVSDVNLGAGEDEDEDDSDDKDGSEEVTREEPDEPNKIANILTALSQMNALNNKTKPLLQTLHTLPSTITSQKIVCQISSNFLSSKDANDRLAAHYDGKSYKGWKLVREKLEELRRCYPGFNANNPSGYPGYAARGGGGYGNNGYNNNGYGNVYNNGRGGGGRGSGGRGGGGRGGNWNQNRGGGGGGGGGYNNNNFNDNGKRLRF